MSAGAEVDWSEARRLFEVERWTRAQIADWAGCGAHRVGHRAKREGWIEPQEIASASSACAVRAFVERQAEAVLQNLVCKAELTRQVLDQTRSYVEAMKASDVSPQDGLRAMRDAAGVVKVLEDVDVSLLRDAPWRTDDKPGDTADPLPTDFDFYAALRKRKTVQEIQ